MERTVNAPEAGRQFDDLLDAVARGEQVVVERAGEPVAAVVPIDVYRRLRRAHAEVFDLMRTAAERASLPEDEAEALALEAQAWARGKRAR